MLNSTITWNGQSSDNFDFKIERYPQIVKAQRQFDKYSVPGRNGDLFYFRDSYSNYNQPYKVYAGKRADNAAQTSWSDVMSWLVPEPTAPTVDDYINLTVNGYHRLIDSYEPDVIRLAAFTEGVSAENNWNHFGKTTINFDCRPERFTSEAFTAVSITANSYTLQNPTDRPAKPFIRVTGTGGTIVVNGYVVNLTSISTYTNIDCESQNAFKTLAENKNNTIILTNGFPILKPGNNTITKGSGITEIEIYPRWWSL